MKKLPKTPSKLLTIALKDLIAVEKSKKYHVRMGHWHTPTHDLNTGKDICAVCLAGAVMAKTLKSDPDLYLYPDSFDSNAPKLEALDYFRCGSIGEGCRSLGVKNKIDEWVDMGIYEYDPVKFKKDMRQLIKTLEKAGM